MDRNGKSFPAVSIIVPAYNAEYYLEQTLESALAQTVRDFEILIVDDGSTDATVRIAQHFEDRDPRIRLLRQQRQGVSAARNAAMAAAQGTYFALLDSDDLWTPGYLAAQLQVLHDHPDIDVVSANAINLGGELDRTVWKTVRPGLHPVSLLTLIRIEDSVSIMSVFRRRVWEQLGGFDATMYGNEDYDFWLRAAAQGVGILFNATPLAYYRRRTDSMSANEAQMLLGIQRPLKKLRRLVLDDSVEASEIDRRLDRFEERRLMAQAKQAIIDRDFQSAAGHFTSLHQRTGAMTDSAMAFAAARLPLLLTWAYSLKRAGRWLRTRPVSKLDDHATLDRHA
jgi:glycosyltransferase involved in cell wall biosynthesis